MRRPQLVIPLVLAVTITVGCSRDTVDFGAALSTAPDPSGRWIGRSPDGASFEERTDEAACAYEADLVLELERRGSELDGTLDFTIRAATGGGREHPCMATGTRRVEALSGDFSDGRVRFTLIDGVTTFTGTLGSGTLNGELTIDGPTPMAGDWRVVR